MKHFRDIAILALLAITIGFGASSVVADATASLSPGLDRLVNTPDVPADSLVSIVVFLEDPRVPVADQAAAASTQTRSARIQAVSNSLKSYVGRNESAIEDYLVTISTEPVEHFWIAPAFRATVPVSALTTLANMSGVKTVIENATVSFDPPVEVERATAPDLSATVAQPLQQLNVPSLWQKGLTGKGRLICSFDTGVEYDHPALASKWRGLTKSLSSTWFSKVAPDDPPADAVGHGTHTMGIMLGNDGADTIGVAPGAQWITAGVIDQGRPLATTIADILEAFQWALDPDGDSTTTDDVPDVILNSWGIPKGLFTPCDQTFATVIGNVEAAGIVTIFAAGNEGPNPMTLRNPADMATTPLNTFSVGAVDNYNAVASFSSRGPSSCDQTSIKPELVAPGVSIRSSWKDGTYKVLSGTSMAAPYIAGLVALMRQYSPNATVDEIKTALISAANDLGVTGEDNSYGYGIVDASRLLDYLPSAGSPDFSISSMKISDDGVASPGEQFGMLLTLTNSGTYTDRVVGSVVPKAAGATMIVYQAAYFYPVGVTTTTNFTPFTVLLSDSLYHGQTLPFELRLAWDQGQHVDTIPFSITLGFLPDGTIGTHTTTQLDMTVSDFGQYGFAPGSIYNIQGDGFKVDGSGNVLYESGIVLGTSEDHVSSAVRDSLGAFHLSDFHPTALLSEPWMGADGGVHRTAEYADGLAPAPIPISVRQETVSYPTVDNNGLLIFKVWLRNESSEPVSNLYFGLLTDFDMASNESLAYDPDLNMMVQTAAGSPAAAVVGLKNVSSFQGFDNADTAKSGFSRARLFDIISAGGESVPATASRDKFFVIGTGPFSLASGDSVEVAFAFVGGYYLTDVYANAAAAHQLYDRPTSADGGLQSGLPTEFSLLQNYPNPFNPTTTIAFELPRAADISLEIFNSLGQKVTTFEKSHLLAGTHSIEWDATGSASGMYFYRLTVGEHSETRKMLLLK